MFHALTWLFTAELLGIIALPLAFTLFRRLPDRGIILSKPLALLLSSYMLWILGLAHILPNSRFSIIGILLVLAVISTTLLRSKWQEIVVFVRKERYALITAELVFLAFFFLWLGIVSSAPAINHTEKPMDFAFLNSILRSTYFPPEDPWLSGHSISYYYFGHFMMAFLTKLTAIPSNVSYNLSIALIPAMLAGGAFSLVYNLIRISGATVKTAVLFALAAPLFIILIGNLEGILEFVQARGWGSEGFWSWVSIKGLAAVPGTDSSFFPGDHWWWWRGTRVIDTLVDGRSLDYTITEFPFFSFLLGDLHPHVTALPFLVLNLALGLNLLLSTEVLGLRWLRNNPWEAAAITLCLGSLAFINIWDFPIFALLLVLLVLVKGYADWGGQVRHLLLSSLSTLLPILLGGVVLFLPFYLTLGSQAKGISTLGEYSTRPVFFFLIWGLFLVISGTFLIKQLANTPGLWEKNPGALSVVAVITTLPFLLWAGAELLALWVGFNSTEEFLALSLIDGEDTVAIRFAKLLPGMAIVATAAYTMLLRMKHSTNRAVPFSLLALALGFYLLVGAELFFLVDLFGNRMNTVFKVYYQAWLLLAIVSAYGLYYVASSPIPSFNVPRVAVRLPSIPVKGTLKFGWIGLVTILLVLSLYYPVGSALDRSNSSGRRTLDGLAFLQNTDPDEYEAIRWLRDEAPKGRIVEAVGGDYSAFGRISSSTGLPTVLGWKSHERQWRGSSKPFEGREEQVAEIYNNSDPVLVQQLLDTYDIKYIYVGKREKTKYGLAEIENFSSFLEPVFKSKDVVIYGRIPDQGQETIESPNGNTG